MSGGPGIRSLLRWSRLRGSGSRGWSPPAGSEGCAGGEGGVLPDPAGTPPAPVAGAPVGAGGAARSGPVDGGVGALCAAWQPWAELRALGAASSPGKRLGWAFPEKLSQRLVK